MGLACGRGGSSCVRLASLLLDAGADPNLADDANDMDDGEEGKDGLVGEGMTPLLRAVAANEVEIARMLLEKVCHFITRCIKVTKLL